MYLIRNPAKEEGEILVTTLESALHCPDSQDRHDIMYKMTMTLCIKE